MPNTVAATTPELCPTCEGAGSQGSDRPWCDYACESCKGRGLRYSDAGCACDVEPREAGYPSDLIAHPEAARLDAEGCLVCGECSVTALVAVLKIIAVPAAAKEAA